MKKNTWLLGALLAVLLMPCQAQELRLRKGVVLDSLPLPDSLPGRTALYLPMSLDPQASWPLLYVLGAGEDVLQSVGYFRNVAEAQGYVVAASGLAADSVNLTRQVIHTGRVLEQLAKMLPLDRQRISVGGFGEGGQLAALIPGLLPGVKGVLALGAVPPDGVLTAAGAPADFVGIMGRADFGYPNMLLTEEQLGRKKVPHFLLYHEGGHQWPPEDLLGQGLQALDLLAVKSGRVKPDTAFIRARYETYVNYVNGLRSREEWILAYDQAEEGIHLFEGLHDTESLEGVRKAIRKASAYSAQRREANNFRYKEDVTRELLAYNLEEDLATFNLKNLGWWNHQMQEFRNLQQSSRPEERLMGLRLEGFINVLADDYIRLERLEQRPDYDALILLYMLKTITDPEAPENYLQVVSLTAKYDDYGTALFYLEELLKRGYNDRAALYALDHTALLRISPEFNALIAKYLGEARYDIPPQAPENR